MSSDSQLMIGADGDELGFAAIVNPEPRRLSRDQIANYNRQGFITPLPLIPPAEMLRIRAYFDQLLARITAMGDGRDEYGINGYHIQCRGLWDLVTDERIIACVQDLVGPDIVCWGSHFFCKLPHDPKFVPWHQDASYWPLRPNRTVTVWLAIDDADAGNSAMCFIPGTHLRVLPAGQTVGTYAADLHLALQGAEQLGTPVVNALKAGSMSLHADLLAHGSEANRSARRRCGLTIRYCPASVRGNGWNGGSVIVRGTDPSGHWANHPRPPGEDITLPDWQRQRINAQ